jgi:hypothetical protein
VLKRTSGVVLSTEPSLILSIFWVAPKPPSLCFLQRAPASFWLCSRQIGSSMRVWALSRYSSGYPTLKSPYFHRLDDCYYRSDKHALHDSFAAVSRP